MPTTKKADGWWLVALLGLAFIIRIAWITWVPARLTVDEMSIGYNAYSILKTGKDEWGRSLPLAFQAFGDFKLPFYIYLTVPFVWLLGLTVLSTKIVSILCGVALVYVLYLMGKRISNDERVGLWTAGVTAFAPWTIQMSRQALESHLALLLFSVGFYLLLLNRSEKKSKWLVLAGVSLGATFYTYIAYRLLIVLLLPVFWWWLESTNKRKVFFITLILIILPLAPGLFSASGLARAKQTSLLTDPGIVAAVDEDRSFCYLVDQRLSLACKILFNKVTVGGVRWVGNYLSFFSPEFLFLSGDKNLYLNHPDYGEFYWMLLPFLLLGFVGLKRILPATKYLLLALLLIAPIPASLSGTAQMVRSSAMLLPLLLLIGLGLVEGWTLLITKWQKVGLGLIGLFIAGQWLVSYLVIYPTKFDNAAYQLPTNIIEYLRHKTKDKQTIYINDKFTDAHMFVAYYLTIDPAIYQATVVRPAADGFGFSHPTALPPYIFGAETFTALYCRNTLTHFAFISPEAVSVTLPDGQRVGYQTIEWKNFSGVHVQARLIEDEAFTLYLETNGLSKEVFCRN